MNKVSLCYLCLVSFLFFHVSTYKIRLERAVQKYVDLEYLKDASTFTFRARRGDPYMTNASLTTLHTWTNNVTFLIYYKLGRQLVEHEVFRLGCCQVFNIKWFVALAKKYSDLPCLCPVQPRTYHITNLLLLPKNFPLPLPEGENYLGAKFILTAGNKVIYHVEATLHVD